MKVLFIGGTGIISTNVSRLALQQGIELTLLNRGQQNVDLPGARWLQGDFHDLSAMQELLTHESFDVVVDWIAFTPANIQHDLDLFRDRVGQFVFISSASAYQKPPTDILIRESTPLHNPFWQYSRDKIACEELLMQNYRDAGFPVTIVRPSHTYDRLLPIPVGATRNSTMLARMRRGLPVIVPGDGTSLWALTHSRDFAIGFLGLLGHPRALGQAFHITSDELLTWNHIYEAIASALGVQANLVHISSDRLIELDPDLLGPLRGDKSWSVIFDNSKIKSYVPQFKAIIPFHQGIKETVAQFDLIPELHQVNQQDDEYIERLLRGYKNS